jgi:hypothetical protein
MTGPRAASLQRGGLATADRWLLAGLMLASSVIVAVLTSALTVRGMQHTGVPVIASTVQPAPVVTTPEMPARDSVKVATVIARPDSALVASTVHDDSAPNRAEATGAVAPPPAARLSPMPVQRERASKHEAPRVVRRPVSIAEHVSATSPTPQHVAQPAISPPLAITSAPAPTAVAGSAPSPVAPPASAPSSTASAPAAPPTAAPAANNVQFLEELRAIHAEIDARKHHMDSLTAALDSLKHVKPE